MLQSSAHLIEAGDYPSCLRQGTHWAKIQRHTNISMGNLPVNLTSLECGRKLEREPIQTQGEHVNSTLMVEMNSGPCCCEAIVLTTMPPCIMFAILINLTPNPSSAAWTACYLTRTNNKQTKLADSERAKS